ncbi:MAG: hypothetical protein ACN4GZ_10780 [Acidimicrobiales bacterium]
MVKFLGAICTLLAGLCLVGVVGVSAVRNLTSSSFLEEVAKASLDDPAAQEQLVDELVDWLDDEPARQVALVATFGADWREPMRDATTLAVQTVEFEAAYVLAFEQVLEAEPGDEVVVTVDLGPTVAAVSPQLERDVVESIERLPSGFFVVTEPVEQDRIDDLNNFRQTSGRILTWLTLAGLAATVLALAVFRSPLPLAWVGAIAIGMSLLQFGLLRAIKDDVVADQEDALGRVGTEAVFDSLTSTTTFPLVFIGTTLILVAIITGRALKTVRANDQTDELPDGSDTDWVDAAELDGFPQIIT